MKPWRNRKYLDWVKRQPCVISYQEFSDPHHIIGHGFSGMGTKAPDWAVIPLCRQIHRELHDIGIKSWEEKYGTQLDLFARFWRNNFDEIKRYISED